MKGGRALTFVVIPLVGRSALEGCVCALRQTPAAIIVVGELEPALTGRIRSMGAEVICCAAPVPRRRAVGAAAARSEWIALIEDTCRIGDAWYATFEALRGQLASDAWSGPIDIAGDLPARCAALAGLEYGDYSRTRWPRLATGAGDTWRPVSRLAGLCLMYRTRALPLPISDDGLIEIEVNERILASGKPLALHPGLAVTYAVADPASATLRSRFQHGRIYAGGRLDGAGWPTRFAGIVKCLALPAVLTARSLAGLPRMHRRRMLTTCWLFGFALAWSAGEATGWLFGRGESLGAWR